MQLRLARTAMGATLLGALTLPATAQWTDNFDTYANGSGIDGQGQWDNWGGVSQPYNTVTNAQASSGPHSVEIIGCMNGCGSLSDTVSWLGTKGAGGVITPYTSGRWILSAEVYVPGATFLNDRSYWILCSQFQPGAVGVEWSGQCYFDAATASFDCDGTPTGGAGAQVTTYDSWVPIETIIDLDLDIYEVWYNGTMVITAPWSPGLFGNNANAGNPALGILDLFPSNDNAPAVYYDNFQIRLDSGPIGTNFCTANNNSTGSPGAISGTGSTLVSDNNVTLTMTGLPASQFGYFVTAGTTTFIPGAGGSQGNLCVGPGGLGRFNLPAGYAIGNSGAAGQIDLVVDLNNFPSSGGSVVVGGGQTHHFQGWYRDLNPGPVSNFTNGLTIMFQ